MVTLALVFALAQWQERDIAVIAHLDPSACVAFFDVRVPSPFAQWEAVFLPGRLVGVELTASGCPSLAVQWEVSCPSWVLPDRRSGVLPVGLSTWVILRTQRFPTGALTDVDDEDIPAVTQTMTGQCHFRWQTCPRGDLTRDCLVGAADVVAIVHRYRQVNPVTPWRFILDDFAAMQNQWEDRWIGRSVDPPTITVP